MDEWVCGAVPRGGTEIRCVQWQLALNWRNVLILRANQRHAVSSRRLMDAAVMQSDEDDSGELSKVINQRRSEDGRATKSLGTELSRESVKVNGNGTKESETAAKSCRR